MKYPARLLRKRYLIVTDGLLTESGYFEKLKPLINDVLEVVAKNKDVDDLVDEAIRRMNRGTFDGVFVVCDVDERLKSEASRKKLMNAMCMAEKNGVRFCLSNESFEVWLLAHITKVNSADGSRGIAHTRALKMGIVCGNNGKEIVDNFMTKDNISRAIDEAKRLKTVYGENVLDSSPNTDVFSILEKLEFK